MMRHPPVNEPIAFNFCRLDFFLNVMPNKTKKQQKKNKNSNQIRKKLKICRVVIANFDLAELRQPLLQCLPNFFFTTNDSRLFSQQRQNDLSYKCAAAPNIHFVSFGIELFPILRYDSNRNQITVNKIREFSIQKELHIHPLKCLYSSQRLSLHLIIIYRAPLLDKRQRHNALLMSSVKIYTNKKNE